MNAGRFQHGECICQHTANRLLGDVRDSSQLVIEATPMQADEFLAAELINEREYLIPG